jgi:CDP-glycerol glycerophosphotransferase
VEIPGCADDWWDLLHAGVVEMWGDRSLTGSGLPPVHRLTGWLVEQGRREDAAAVMAWMAAGGEADRTGPRLRLPGLTRPALDDVAPEALALRDHER